MSFQTENQRIVIEMLGEVPPVDLPDGWIGLSHKTGAIVYLHKETRVVTWSRPYQISKSASLRKHDPPLLAIPCLHQKVAQGKCHNEIDMNSDENLLPQSVKENDNINYKTTILLTKEDSDTLIKESKLENFKENECLLNSSSIPKNSLNRRPNEQEKYDKNLDNIIFNSKEGTEMHKNSLVDFETVDYTELHEYLSRLFTFKENPSWRTVLFSDRLFNKTQTLASNTRKKVIIKIENKTPLQILHEYGARLLNNATVEMTKLEVKNFPDFCVEACISGRMFGIGSGEVLRKAKQAAAVSSLDILDPTLMSTNFNSTRNEKFKKFDDVDIEDRTLIHLIKEHSKIDSTILELPFVILKKLLKRNFKRFEEEDLIYHVTNKTPMDATEHRQHEMVYKKDPELNVSVLLETNNPETESDDIFQAPKQKRKREDEETHVATTSFLSQLKDEMRNLDNRENKDTIEGNSPGMKATHGRELAAQLMIKKLYPMLQNWGAIIRLSQEEVPEPLVKSSSKKKPNVMMITLKDAMLKMAHN